MQHWLGRDARQQGPWLGAATMLQLVRAHVLPRILRRTAELLQRIPDPYPRPDPTHVRVLAGATATTLVLGVAAAIFFDDLPARYPRSATYASGTVSDVRVPAAGGSTPDPEPDTETRASGSAEVDGAVLAAPESPEATPPAPPALPTGKGMWFHKLEQAQGGPREIVAHAQAIGLSHLYVRTGSSRMGFYAQSDLDQLLPVAHAAGLQVVGWDFPYLDDPLADAARAVDAITYTTPDGHRLDGFSADIETPSEGVKLGRKRVAEYVGALRDAVGPDYPLIGTVPNACLNKSFPYAEVAGAFDAFAPMVYWITRDPAADVACNIERLGSFGLPVLPIGQAYDPAIDNPTLTGHVPRYGDLAAFMQTANDRGVASVSFWAWHTATPEMWQAIADG